MMIRRSFRLIGCSCFPSSCRSVAMLPEHRKKVCVVAAGSSVRQSLGSEQVGELYAPTVFSGAAAK
jgi:hypothetical protein